MLNLFVSLYHFLWALFSALFFSLPSREMKVIGVTGTLGKSTVVDLATEILEERGFKVASLSSIKIKIADEEEKNLFKMTMPGRGYLQRFLRRVKDRGCQYVLIEVTSEGILQHRHGFIDFDTAVFTNLYPEHIERHGSFENYRAAKGKLFRAAKDIHVLNLDDKNVDYFLQFPVKKKIGFTMSNQQPVISNEGVIRVVKARDCEEKKDRINFRVENISFHLNLIGKFNIQNALTAICIGISQGVPLEICKRALERISSIPGRMEIVIRKPFKVVVDYAHIPDALQKVYQTLKTDNQQPKTTRMICVVGSCGGGRDKWKRPKLGEIASRFCNEIIITNEDPYDEPPIEIIEQVFEGVVNKKKQMTKKILDRREAIREALKLAKAGDVVIITGKGCEPWMCIAGGRKIPWDDRKIVKEEIEKLKIPLAP